MKIKYALSCLLALTLGSSVLRAEDAARFDLDGPKILIRVTRGGVTLPIAQVPNLMPGDKLWIKADLPQSQSNHLLLIVAFLRGTTNEPPDNWFNEIDTWEKKSAEGTTITVPNEAQQALVFVAPETGGDFKTLRSAVKGKPGLFIRADADLNEASFEQQRIQHYLAAMKTVKDADAKVIQDRATKLEATLGLKVDDKCFKLPVEQQVNCLTQTSAPKLLDDGHGQSIAEAMSTGASSDFINTASYTQAAGAGLYSAYVGAVVDLVHLVTLLKTAQYQYIPGLSFPEGETLNLKLNAPPSFHNPKTVIVIGLPAIQKGKTPPLKPHDPDQVACLLNPKMTLQIEGAPLVFATSFAHELVLKVHAPDGAKDIPLTPDAFEGGLMVGKETKPGTAGSAMTVTGTIQGKWGFDSFEGPTVPLQQVEGKGWKIAGDTQLVAGKDEHLALSGEGVACVQKIALTNDKDKDVDVAFKPAAGKEAKSKLDLSVSLKEVKPGGYSLAIAQYGEEEKDKVALTAYSGDIHLEAVKIHAGDSTATLTGQGVGNVVSVEMGKETFTPQGDDHGGKSVELKAKDGASPQDGSDAQVKLKDGRTLTVKVSAEAARPGLKLVSFKATAAEGSGVLPIVLGGKDDIPLNGKLTFVVQTENVFPRTQTIEVGTADGAVHTTLSIQANTLVLQDEHTAVGTLEPVKAFGESAFGKLAMRPVAADGTAGDWTGLGVLVRTPEISVIDCAADGSSCDVKGKKLFLMQSVGVAKDDAKPTDVPTGFADGALKVFAPQDGSTLYLKLRDDPSAVAEVKLSTPLQKPDAAKPAVPAPAPTPVPQP